MMKATTPKFLVVEDNDLDLEKIKRGFRRLGIENEIVHARDGIEALEILGGTEASPALSGQFVVLLDLNMPRMNGLELLESIRQNPDISQTPVVVISTSNRAADVEAAYRRNVSGYLVKPMQTEKMYDALATLKTYWESCELPRNY
ncbi:MAG: response regulator [Gammaproteobacteria bacterium]